MDPLWLLYTDAAGAPAASMSSVSSGFCEFCTSAVNLVASAELIDDACTITLRASRTLLALCNCIIEDPPFISFSMMAIALPNVSITSNNSFCDFSKSACSFPRIAAAAFKSASVVAALPTRSSILVWRDSLEAPSSECQITRLRLAPSSELFVHSVSLDTFGFDLRLKVCLELNHLVHWVRRSCAAKGWQRQSGETEQECLHCRRTSQPEMLPYYEAWAKMATDFLFSFISVLSISCFLIFFFFPCFLCLVLSFTSFVIDLICLYFLLPAIINYLCVPLSMSVSILSCRFCFIFCVNASLFLTSCFSSFVLLFFLHRFSSSFWPFFSFVFHFFCWVFSYSFFFYFSFYVSSCFSLLVFICLFSSKMFVYACFVFAIFLLFRSLSTKYLVSFVSFSLFPTFSKTNSFFSGHLISFLVFLANKKNSQFKIPFWSSSFLFLCFSFLFPSVDSFHVSTPWYVPSWCSLSLCPPSSLLLSLFCCQNFSKKKTFLSLLLLENLRASFQSPLSFPLFISFSETPSVVLLLFWFRLFSLLHFQFCSFEK